MIRKPASAIKRRDIAYLRVSTDEQGLSIAAQRERLTAFGVAMGHEIDDVIVDEGYSGGSLRRPGIEQLLSAIAAREIAAVYVVKLDRLSRRLRDVLEILDLCQRTGTTLLSASENLDTSSAVGTMLIHLLGTFGEFERGRIAERTAEVLGHKRRQSRVYGPVPFGYRRDGDTLVRHADEYAALVEAVQMDAAGAPYRKIAAMLTARGLTPHRGKAWYPSSVRAMLRSRMALEVSSCE